MRNDMKAVFELSPAAMLAVEKGIIIHANSRAAELFGLPLEGRAAVGKVPDHILGSRSDNFVASALLEGKAYCVSATKCGETLYLSFAPERSGASTEFLSDSLMGNMLSSLFNIGLTIDRVGTATADCGNSRLEDYLAILNHNYYNMRHALSNLSTSIALKNATLPYSFRTVDLARLCSDVVSTVSIMFANRGLTIEFSTPIGRLYGLADGEKVERILLNILSNSLAHTPRGGKISVGLEKSGDNAYISVTDNGSGIPAAELAEVFTKYDLERGSESLSALPTGGLGLGVARGLAEGHGGALIIESREGKGTSVRIMLPLKSDRLNTLESPTESYVNSGMSLILTELAPLLDSDCYTRKYLE